MKKILCILATVLFCLPCLFSADTPPQSGEIQNAPPENAVVRIEVYASFYDFTQPWKPQNASFQITGVVLDGCRILTHTYTAAYRTKLTVYRNNDDTPYIARVLFADFQSELCLLTVNDPDFFKGITPLKIGGSPADGSPVELITIPQGAKAVLRKKGIVSGKERALYNFALMNHDAVKIRLSQEESAGQENDAPPEPQEEEIQEPQEEEIQEPQEEMLAEEDDEDEEVQDFEMELPQNQEDMDFSMDGSPVLFNGEIAGIVFDMEEESAQDIHITDTGIIRHFLTDIQDGHVDGFGEIGIETQPLVNADARACCKMKDGQTGIYVHKKYPGNLNKVKTGDVILAMDGHPVSNDGMIRLQDGSLQPYRSYLDGKQFHESTVLHILRNGTEKNITVPFQHFNYGLKPRLYYSAPEYYIFGGYVFMPLNRSFLDHAFHPLLFFAFDKKVLENPDDEIVILSKVLQDAVNEGYSGEYAQVVESFNGKKIHNLKDLISRIENCRNEYGVLRMYDDTRFFMNLPELRKASPEILSRNNISSDRRLNP